MNRTYFGSILAAVLLATATVPAIAAGQKTRTTAATAGIVTAPTGAIPTLGPIPTDIAPAGAPRNAAAVAAPAFEPAPIPNQDLFAPVQRASEDPQLNPAIFKPNTQFRGDGVLPGSSAQNYEERHMMPAAGLNLNVPLK